MKRNMISEKLLERRLTKAIKDRGGLCLKWYSATYVGLPDRLIILPTGDHLWAEIKTTGKSPRPTQVQAIKRLRGLGAKVYIVDGLQAEAEILRDIDNMIRLNSERNANDR